MEDIMEITNEQKRLVLDWMRKIHTLEYAHRYASIDKDKLNYKLGLPATIISGLIGVQIASPWNQEKLTQIIISIGASLAAILVGIQTLLKTSEVAEKHRYASAAYEDLRHRLEFLFAFNHEDGEEIRKQLEQFKAEWDRFQTPNVSNKQWLRAKARVTEVGTYPESLRIEESTPSEAE
jgi:hypothetical protein